jgi:release factor glutamine methyltransferase
MSSPSLFEELLEAVKGFFEPRPDLPEETPDSVLRALWFMAAGQPRSVSRVLGLPLPGLGESEVEALKGMIERLRESVPLAYLTGRQEFMDMEFLAGPGAMIPRKESEFVGRTALALLRERARSLPELNVIDVCTGSGNLALSYAFHEPKARVYGSDLSKEAVALARRNAEFTGLSGRVDFRTGDLFASFENSDLVGRCDLVSANPPFISSAKVPKMPRGIAGYEPVLAFDGGVYGISILTRIFEESPKFLKPGGILCCEVGLGQGPTLEKRVRRMPWVKEVEAQLDPQGAFRMLVVTREG